VQARKAQPWEWRQGQFARRNRITLINGAELKHLIKPYLGYDVLPGTSPPRGLRTSDNTQGPVNNRFSVVCA
jgi:hypothetical protein